MPSNDLGWMVTCTWYVESMYSIEASTRQLSWTLCRSPAPGAAGATTTGSRIMSDADLAGVRAGLVGLVLGASGDCATARSDKWVSMYRPEFVSFNNDIGACSGEFTDPPFVIGLDALVQTVAALAGITI